MFKESSEDDLTLKTKPRSERISSISTSFRSSLSSRRQSSRHFGGIISAPPSLSYKLTRHTTSEFGYLTFAFDALHKALETSSGKPIMCIKTAPNHDALHIGRAVFEHPLIVECLESLFVTIHEQDNELYNDFPVVEFVDEGNYDLVEPIPYTQLNFYTMVHAMQEALLSSGHSIPKYLDLLSNVGAPSRSLLVGSQDICALEVELSSLHGMLSTRIGRHDAHHLVLQVQYDPKQLKFCEILRKAMPFQSLCLYGLTNDERMAARVEASRFHKEIDFRDASPPIEDKIVVSNGYSKLALRQTPMRFVPLTQLQATLVNRLIHNNQFNEAMRWLSPKQGLILMEATRRGTSVFYDVTDVPIQVAWESINSNTAPPRALLDGDPTCPDDSYSESEDGEPEVYNLLGTM